MRLRPWDAQKLALVTRCWPGPAVTRHGVPQFDHEARFAHSSRRLRAWSLA